MNTQAQTHVTTSKNIQTHPNNTYTYKKIRMQAYTTFGAQARVRAPRVGFSELEGQK